MRKIPMRKCVVSQEQFPKKDLLRVVRTPDGEIKVDPTGRANGRGAYLKADLKTITLAQKDGALNRALRTKVSDDLYEELKKYVS